MKCTIPEISWHNREPVLSVHIQPINEEFYRLATGGADCHVLIWQLNINENGAVKMEALSDLKRHQRAVNCVRWSPNGKHLASADDDANIIVWQLKTDNIPLLDGDNGDREVWIVFKVMRGHKEDIYDLCWSPNSLKLLSGSIDNTAILWDVNKGKMDTILPDHKGFVQGVCWHPKNHYIATISTDRTCRILDINGKQVKSRIFKGSLPVPTTHHLDSKDVKYFHDDTFKSFFRRLDFSPDGLLLAVPSGRVEVEDCKKILHSTYLFLVDSWANPASVLPSGNQCSTVTKFCPVLFELHEEGPEPLFPLQYRMVLAVGTDHDIMLYDTQQLEPFAYFKDIHYTRLTDLTWSPDGLMLIASSTDGFCALITFEPGEIGTVYTKIEAEESQLDVSGCEPLEVVENKPKKPNLLEKWTIKTPNKRVDEKKASNAKRITPIAVQQNGSEKKEVKASPLLKFIKRSDAKKSQPVSEAPVIVLDEIEARDSWKCEAKPETNPKEDSIEETMDDFHLQLEDTGTQSKLDQKMDVDAVIADENKTESKSDPDKTPLVTVKRRIPLITLSSPKQKKKAP